VLDHRVELLGDDGLRRVGGKLGRGKIEQHRQAGGSRARDDGVAKADVDLQVDPRRLDARRKDNMSSALDKSGSVDPTRRGADPLAVAADVSFWDRPAPETVRRDVELPQALSDRTALVVQGVRRAGKSTQAAEAVFVDEENFPQLSAGDLVLRRG
jgi:hypothetical protein